MLDGKRTTPVDLEFQVLISKGASSILSPLYIISTLYLENSQIGSRGLIY